MVSNKFLKAKCVWIEGKTEQMNYTVLLKIKLSAGKNTVRIAASSFYRLLLNGKMIRRGAVRTAKGFAVIEDTAIISNGKDVLFAEVSGYGCYNVSCNKEPHFIGCEVICDNDFIFYTDENSVLFTEKERLERVPRFSSQRGFTECYRFDNDFSEILKGKITPYNQEPICLVEAPSFLRGEGRMESELIESAVFRGTGKFTASKKPLNTYRWTDTAVGAFDRNALETDPSLLLNGCSYTSVSEENHNLKSCEYGLYKFKRSFTGFVGVNFTALTDSKILVVFDEILSGENQSIDFSRNDTFNFISYEVKIGSVRHLSFEPYTAQYMAVVVIEGEVKVNELYISRYENRDTDKFSFFCSNKNLEKVVAAAVNTFRQNSVDILTDCPSRERAGWMCDSWFSANAEKLFTGGNIRENNLLEAYERYKGDNDLPKGMLPMCYPGEFFDKTYIPNWALWYVAEIFDKIKRDGTDAVSLKHKGKVYNLISYFSQFENEYGLLENVQGWVFVEWSKANSYEYLCGVNFPSNMMYAYALFCAGNMYNDNELIEKSKRAYSEIRRMSFDGRFFNDNAVRVDGKLKRTGKTSETCQYYAFFTGTSDKKTYNNLFLTLVNDFGKSRNEKKVYPEVCKSNAFIGNYLRLVMLTENGFRKKARYGNIMKKNAVLIIVLHHIPL